MTFDTLKLDKGLYTAGKGFTKALEEIDPSENYKGTELEGLDAYERQLKRFDIKVKGASSDTISSFFKTSDSAVLFPEFVSRAVAVGLNNNDILNEIVATTTIVDSLDYRSIVSEPIEDAPATTAAIAEGAVIPETEVKASANLTELHKYGRTLVASYEALKSQRLDLFTVTLKQIGNYIAGCELLEAINALSKTGCKTVDLTEASKLSYTDFINMWKELAPYNMNTVVAEGDTVAKILGISEFKDSMAGQTFHGTGKLVTPLGANLVYAKTNVLNGGIIAFDKGYALEKVQFGNIVTDFDKLIDRQLERATVTSTSGFNRIIDDSVVLCA